MTSPAPDLRARITDPTWFPATFDVAGEAFAMQHLPGEVIAAASFLDQRVIAADAPRQALAWQTAAAAFAPAPRLAWIFHTGFCGSTLLARILQDPPRAMSLREPRALLDLAHAIHHLPEVASHGALAALLGLLARPWQAGGQCLVKPTNHANNLLPHLLRGTTGRAIVLYSSLPEFILSRCSKLPTAERYTRWLAQHLLRSSRLPAALGVAWDHDFHFVEACVLAWHAQMELFADALAADADDRLRSLDFARLRADPDRIAPASADWLGLGGDTAFWQARASAELSRDAKHVERAFDARQRTAERQALRERHRGLLDAALAWSERVIVPLATLPANWKPLLPAHA